jgi:hypothetical protein
VKTTAPSVPTLARLLPGCLPLEHKRDSHYTSDISQHLCTLSQNIRVFFNTLDTTTASVSPFPISPCNQIGMSDQSKKLAHELGGYEWIRGKHYNSMIRIYPRGKISSMTDLWVSFERTVRVSDNGNVNSLPPSLGHFPIFNTSNYEKTLPAPMAAKGGYFLPMHRMCCLFLCANTC